MDEISAKPRTFLKFHQCCLLLSAGELAPNTHLCVSVHDSRSAQQGDGADHREVPVSDAGAQGWLHHCNFTLLSDSPTLLHHRAPFAFLALPNSSFLAPGRAWGDPSPAPVCLPAGR